MKDMLQRFRTATLVGGPAEVAQVRPEAHQSEGATAAQIGGANVLILQGFAEGRTVFHLPDQGEESPAHASRALPMPDASETCTASDAEAAILSAALLRRFGVEHLPGDAPVATRHALILQRLSVVRDTCAVMIAGRERSMRITMANGCVMATTVDLPGRKQRVITFQKKQLGKAAAREFAVLLAELCAGSVDLLITEAPASGVFDAAAGVLVGTLVTAAGLGPAERAVPG